MVLILGAIAVGEVPRFHFNRATLALSGAVIVLVLGIIPLTEAYQAIDWNTLALLLAMMIFTAHLRLAGFFEWAARPLVRGGSSPRRLLALILGASAVFSALFINDTVVLVLTPLVCEVTLGAALNPLPFLMALALGSNIGSMVTPIGNPQNILIASSSGLGFGAFTSSLAVPALLSLTSAFGLLCLVYRKSLTRRTLVPVPGTVRVFRPLLIKCGLGFALMILGFLAGLPLALSALAGSVLLLFTRRVKAAKILSRIDGTLLLFFCGLFIITRAVESTPGFRLLTDWAQPGLESHLGMFAFLAALLSNLISNVPAVMVIKPMIGHFSHPDTYWIVLAGVSTLAGNLTLLGSVANLIVAEGAKSRGIRLKFGEYLKTGLPVTLVSITLTVVWLSLFSFTSPGRS